MFKKILSKQLCIIALLVCFISSSTVVFAANKSNKISPKISDVTVINSAVVVHSIGAPGWGQTDIHYYLQPADARQLANDLQYSDAKTFGLYILCLFGTKVPVAALLGGIVWAFSTNNAHDCSQIWNLSLNGPVEVIVSETPYGTYVNSQQWDSTKDSLNLSTYDYYSNGYHYFDNVTGCTINY